MANSPHGRGGDCARRRGILQVWTSAWQRHAPLDDPALPDQSARSAHDRPPRWRHAGPPGYHPPIAPPRVAL